MDDPVTHRIDVPISELRENRFDCLLMGFVSIAYGLPEAFAFAIEHEVFLVVEECVLDTG